MILPEDAEGARRSGDQADFTATSRGQRL